ncbi:MAG: preprotein translocase subunit YajC [Lentisphaerae bacterium]|jgi:preprotein translocase subunit YajC|nr:preprotein translocase subunit YajC [Lentisphaerota bacterium]
MNYNFQPMQIEQITTFATGSPEAPSPMGGGMGAFLPIILIFAIMYFIMIRPAQRKEKERKQEIANMTAGSKVLFGGGIIGTIVEIRDATFLIEIANNVIVEAAKGSVQRKLNEDTPVAMDDSQ